MPNLTEHQQQCKQAICTFVRQTAVPVPPLVMALAGRRGMGKSTIIEAVKREFSSNPNVGPDFVTVFAGNVDAATAQEDFGLMAAIVDELYQSALEASSPNEGSSNKMRGVRVKEEDESSPLARARDGCVQVMLKQEESHRSLARDLAMSPSHFGELMRSAASERRELLTNFRKLIHEVGEVHAKAHRVRSVRLVLALDDLDLANPQLVSRFVRSLLDDYRWLKSAMAEKEGHSLFWLFAFDRRRIIEQLSPANYDNTRDSEVGRSLLEKMVPFHQMLDLRAFTDQQRREFRSRHAPPPRDTLESLLVRHGQAPSAALALLPAQPRALEGLYNWLAGLSEPETRLSRLDILHKMALVVGEYDFAASLQTWSLARFAALVEWDERTHADVVSWPDVAASCADTTPIWGLPVPQPFRNGLIQVEPQGFFEALLDLLLDEEIVSPYQLLQRMPFARLELEHCTTRYVEHLEDTVVYLSKPGAMLANAVLWQEWKKVNANWAVDIGPAALWKTLYQMRSATPADLFEDLPALDQSGFDAALEASSRYSKKENLAVLPNYARALLWLVAGLARIPWHDAAALNSIWSILTRTRLAVAYTLSAYIWCIWGEREFPEDQTLHLAWHRSLAKLGALTTEDDVAQRYCKFVDWCDGKVRQGFSPTPVKTGELAQTVGDLARRELLRALGDLLKLSAVQGLKPAETKQKGNV